MAIEPSFCGPGTTWGDFKKVPKGRGRKLSPAEENLRRSLYRKGLNDRGVEAVLGVNRSEVSELYECISREFNGKKRWRYRNLPCARGGLHLDDVALMVHVFLKHGLRRGMHFDFYPEDEDGHHWEFLYDDREILTKDASKQVNIINSLGFAKMEAAKFLLHDENPTLRQAEDALRKALTCQMARRQMPLVCEQCSGFANETRVHQRRRAGNSPQVPELWFRGQANLRPV